jgi:hypothetical protein
MVTRLVLGRGFLGGFEKWRLRCLFFWIVGEDKKNKLRARGEERNTYPKLFPFSKWGSS